MAKKKAKRKITKKQSRRPSARVKQRTAKTKPRKILMLIGGPLFHPTQQAAELLAGLLQARGGRWEVNATSDYDTLASLPGSGYDAVLIYMTGSPDDLTPEREKGLLDFVKAGGGLVGVHSAADSFRGSRAYIRMLNAEFRTHPRKQPIPVRIVDRDHYLTVRMPDFVVEDELYILQAHDPQKSRILAETTWQGKRLPIAFVHPFGKGRVAYLALGHDLTAWQHPEFQKLLLRSLEWTQGAEVSKREIRCGVLGYGPAFNMGKGHGEWMNATPGLRTVAACDTNPERMKAAKEELPGIRTFESLDAMLKMKDLDLVVNILPHNLHAETSLACLRAGKAIVSEKPFCITTDEATKMIRAAQRAKVMLSVFHNRRWDGDYLAIRDIIARGLLGDVYHIECCSGSYDRPGTWWRSDKMISGGALYDWGAHFTDWILRLVDKRVTQVTGFFHKRLWNHVTNEDATQAIVRFEDGTMADLQQSSLAAVGKPMWRILGTLGGLVANGKDTVDVTSYASGVKFEGKIPAKSSYGSVEYYRNIADHLLLGEPLAVTAEQGREVIAVIETAERSSAEGRSLPLPAEVYED